MTLIISEPSVAEQTPLLAMKTQKTPAYCAICACPCLTPRLPTPQPYASDPDLVCHDLPTPTWLHQFHHLQPSSGILPYPTPIPDRRDTNNPHKRIVRIHLYCLRAVLDIVKSGFFDSGGMNDEQVMIGYSIPRYTGSGPWMSEGLRSIERPEMSWMGQADQRGRWESGVQGSHLKSYDLQCPIKLDEPSHMVYAFDGKARFQQSLMAKLPSHIMTDIALLVLRDGETQPIHPEQDLIDLLSLCRTSQAFRQLYLPQATWAALAREAVNRYINDLIQCWKARLSGRSGTGQLRIALDEAFAQPVEEALEGARGSAQKRLEVSPWDKVEEVWGFSARDVLYWWLYSDAWRSRRRIWHCVVHATATAKHADWW